MDLTRRLYVLGGWCARHGWVVLLLWLAFLVGVNAADRFLPPPAREAFVLAGTNSAEAQTLLNRAFPGAASQPAPVVVHAPDGLVDAEGELTPTSVDLFDDVAVAVAAAPDVNEVTTPVQDATLLAEDGRTALVLVRVDERASGAEVTAEEIQAFGQEAAGDRAEVALGGFLGEVISAADTRPSEALGLMIAFVVLLTTLRRGWPVIIPFATAIAAVGSGLAIVGLLERITFIPAEATILGTMLGLGVGIDYALFLVTKHRVLMRRGFEVEDSAARTAGTAGAGMVFAGGTLIAAVSGLVLTGISFLAWLGFAAAVIVGIAVAGALTLVPAMFGIMGPRVLPKRMTDAVFTDEDLDTGRWARLSNAVTRRPWRSATVATALLLALSAPLLSMSFGQNDGTAYPPQSPAHRSTVLIDEGFGPGTNGPLVVVARLNAAAVFPEEVSGDSDGDPRTEDQRLVDLHAAIAADPGVAEVSDPVVSTDGGVAIYEVTPASGPADPATEELVFRLRAELLPEATSGQGIDAFVGGVTAAVTDLSERVAERLVPFIVGVVVLAFLLIMVAYRSLVIPLKAAAMNLLSIGAAYGVIVMVFQWGWGAELIGLEGPVPIESFVPMMMFAVLFGLSMDYEVFLLTSFREHFERSGDVAVAVRRALADTGQVITSAALIMVGVFGSFVLNDQTIAKMFGLGLATAVLVDATIVRCVLVPAIMVLAAKRTFWLPGWLDRAMPQLHVEGDPSALSSINDRRRPSPDPRVPAVMMSAAVLAVLAAWFVGRRAGGLESADAMASSMRSLVAAAPGGQGVYADLAVAVSAVAGGLVAWLPRGMPGAGQGMGVRLLAFLGGVSVVGVAYPVITSFVPPAQVQAGRVAGLALLVCVAVAVLPGVRRAGVPVAFGGVAMAVSVAVGGYGVRSTGSLLRDAVLPAVLALVLAVVLNAVAGGVRGQRGARRRDQDPTVDPQEPVEPVEQEPVGATR